MVLLRQKQNYFTKAIKPPGSNLSPALVIVKCESILLKNCLQSHTHLKPIQLIFLR